MAKKKVNIQDTAKRVSKKDYYQGAAAGAIVTAVIVLILHFIF